MKKYKTTIIITTLITLLPIVIGLFLWNKLPDTLATHWGSDGTANGWSSKTFSVFGMPLILTAIHVLCLFVTLNDPKKKNIHKKPMALIFWLVPVISLLANCSTYLIALGVDFSIEIFISALIGVFFIVLGNYMPKLQQNYTIGIKLPWTLNSEENWNRTHRLGGKLYIVMGIAMILMSFIDSLLGSEAAAWIILSVITIGAIIPAAYSFYLYKKGILMNLLL